ERERARGMAYGDTTHRRRRSASSVPSWPSYDPRASATTRPRDREIFLIASGKFPSRTISLPEKVGEYRTSVPAVRELLRGVRAGPSRSRMPMNEPRKSRILIVDDDRELAETLADGLLDRGYDAVAVASSKDAARRLGSEDVDALVTDLRMPGVDG